ncbi:MAG: PEP-CTERM sorting domain-containing protein [Alphaproteobacteria bacterium]|nr:MAG: PEP-CTERM sorting domain-containing protein [Alphaproteobacteria bacterium]
MFAGSREKGACAHRASGIVAVIGYAGVLVMVPAGAKATMIVDTFDFQVSNQQIWGGAAPVFEETLANLPLGGTIGPGNLVADFGLLGQYGIEAGLTAQVDVGLQSRLRNFHLGSVDINFPVNVELNFPDQVNAGQTFTISSSFSVGPGAGFTTIADQSELDFSADAALSAGLNLRACIVTCFVDNTDPSSPFFFQENVDLGTFDLITQTKDNTIINIDLPDIGQPAAFVGKPTIPGAGIDIDPTQDLTSGPDAIIDLAIAETTNISGKITVPDLSQSGGLTSAATLSGKVVDVFTDIAVDLDSMLSPPLPPLGIGPVNISGVTFGADIFDASLVTKLIADQMIEFQGVPKAILDLGPLGIVELVLGESVDVTAPANVSELQISPTYVLDNTFSNTTVVAAAQQTDITFGGLQFSFPKITVIPGLPPVVIPGTSGFCLIRNPFTGKCKVFVPGTPPITITSGTDDVNVGPFSFDEAIFEETITDSLINTSIGGVPLSVGVCDVNPNACAFLPLLDEDQARTSGLFEDQQSFAFPTFSGQGGRILVTGPLAVPEPSALALMILGLAMVGASQWRRRLRT